MCVHIMKSQTCGAMIVVAFCASVVVSSSAASAQVLNEAMKLLPSDREPGVVYADAKFLTNNGTVGDEQSTASPLSPLLATSYEFGRSIAVTSGVVAVGIFGDRDGSGAAYLFDAAAGNQLFRLIPDDGARQDRFGTSVALNMSVGNGGIVAVGAVGDGDNGQQSGSAYLFDVFTGAQLRKLHASDGEQHDRFGTSIAIGKSAARGIVAVGAIGDDDNGIGSGSAYLFDAATGDQLFKLLPNDGEESDRFGHSIAIDLSIGGGIVAVGASPYRGVDGYRSGSVYLFDASTGEQLFKLFPDNDTDGNGFGRSIAIDNGIVAVGVYVFDAVTGVQIARLRPTDDAEEYRFGHCIAIHNGIIAAGGTWGFGDNGYQLGSAYLFDAATGEQLAKLLPSDGARMEFFGNSVSIDNGIVAVGAKGGGYKEGKGKRSGAAYIFDVSHLLEEHAEKKADENVDVKAGNKAGDKADAPYEPDEAPECCSDK